MHLNTKSIFRAYDIRGTYPEPLNTDLAFKIGLGFGTYLIRYHQKKDLRVVVGRDNRTHGKELQESFINGLIKTGCHVTNIGLAASPYLYFSNTHDEFDGGCNVTASHNPGHYNGFKLITQNGHAVFGDEIQKIYELIQNNDFESGEGTLEDKDYTEAYWNKINSIFHFQKSLKMVIDTGNGIAGKQYPEFFKRMGHDVIELFTELDGTFPNHQPDPIVEENLEDLKKKVLQEQADIGFAFDGDGDRVSLVTEKGEMISSDYTLMLLAQDALKRNPGKSVVFTVSNSQLLFDLVKKLGGHPVMSKVGHSFVEEAMNKNQAILGGEQSGHFFVPENYYAYDDALVTAMRIAQIISESTKKSSDAFTSFPKAFQNPEIRPFCPDNQKFETIEKITEFFKKEYVVNDLDGARIDFSEGAWAGIRASNTSPRLSIVIEALSKEKLDQIKQIVFNHLNSYNQIDFNR